METVYQVAFVVSTVIFLVVVLLTAIAAIRGRSEVENAVVSFQDFQFAAIICATGLVIGSLTTGHDLLLTDAVLASAVFGGAVSAIAKLSKKILPSPARGALMLVLPLAAGILGGAVRHIS